MKSVEAWVRRVRSESVPCKERRLVKFKAARGLKSTPVREASGACRWQKHSYSRLRFCWIVSTEGEPASPKADRPPPFVGRHSVKRSGFLRTVPPDRHDYRPLPSLPAFPLSPLVLGVALPLLAGCATTGPAEQGSSEEASAEANRSACRWATASRERKTSPAPSRP